ncbi:hypothetical protein JYQ74_02470, partial [Anaerostipes hadrus]|nr:hypothetical protein [Anaerostipes hadrus]
ERVIVGNWADKRFVQNMSKNSTAAFVVFYLFFILYSKPTVGKLQIQIILHYQILLHQNRFNFQS